MKTYNFKVVVEPDEDFDGNPRGFHAYCAALDTKGASTMATDAELQSAFMAVRGLFARKTLRRV